MGTFPTPHSGVRAPYSIIANYKNVSLYLIPNTFLCQLVIVHLWGNMHPLNLLAAVTWVVIRER